jgi:hypothetical protein
VIDDLMPVEGVELRVKCARMGMERRSEEAISDGICF